MSAFVTVMVDFRDVLTVIKLWLIGAEVSKPSQGSAHIPTLLKMNDSGGFSGDFKTLKLYPAEISFIISISVSIISIRTLKSLSLSKCGVRRPPIAIKPVSRCGERIGIPLEPSGFVEIGLYRNHEAMRFYGRVPNAHIFPLGSHRWPHATYLGHPLEVISVSCGPLKPARLGVYLVE